MTILEKQIKAKKSLIEKALALLLTICGFFAACSFDYGNNQTQDDSKPDIIMLDVEYVRVRGGDVQVRLWAESAERFETANTMNLRNFTFEEFSDGNEVNIAGSAGSASVEMDSGNISLTGGVKVSVESEDYTIETPELHWLDKEKQLSTSADGEVLITRSDGKNFIGRGFSADARYRTWVFESGIEGYYVESDSEENEELEVRNEE
jgi:LPS export ABC transporter protein LptC